VISRNEAIAIARQAAVRSGSDDVLQADFGRYADLEDVYAAALVSPSPAPNRLVWRITLGTNHGPLEGQGAVVVVDSHDGRVLQIWEWVS
jgi:hypothetical protein